MMCTGGVKINNNDDNEGDDDCDNDDDDDASGGGGGGGGQGRCQSEGLPTDRDNWETAT